MCRAAAAPLCDGLRRIVTVARTKCSDARGAQKQQNKRVVLRFGARSDANCVEMGSPVLKAVRVLAQA